MSGEEQVGRCPTCGAPVNVWTGDEGTSSYEPIADPRLAALLVIRALVKAQAEDEGLWFIAETAPEAYLQSALRRLHAACEDIDRGAREATDD